MIGCSPPTLRVVVLAAGFSTRLGQPKALARVRGTSLLLRTLSLLRPFAAASRVIVVIPARTPRYRLGTDPRKVEFVVNPRRGRGLSSSVIAGLKHARRSAAVLLLPVDLVELDARDMARLVFKWRGARRKVTARRVQDRPAVPLILPRAYYPAALKICGDRGLRDFVWRLPPESLRLLDLASAEADVDTPEDLEHARRRRHLH